MKERIRNNKFSLIVAIILIVVGILYVAIDSGDHTFSWLSFAMLLAGAATLLLGMFLPAAIRVYVPLLSAALVAVAFGQQLLLSLETLSDVWNGVNFIGGNPVMGVMFSSLFLLSAIALVVRCFIKGKTE